MSTVDHGGRGAQHALNRAMRHISLACFALAVGALPGRLHAQGSWLTASAPQSRTVVSFEISAAVVTRRAPNEWLDAVPAPLLDRMAADEHFEAIDLGQPAGNGILIRFQFDDMESYKQWNDAPEVQQMLAEIEQVIGYGYSRSSISMRRVAIDRRAVPAAPPRNAPIAPPTRPKSGERMASTTP
jgi:hypothetical protein